MHHKFNVENHTKCKLPTKNGWFDFIVWNMTTGKEPVALVTEKLDASFPVTVRIHSECLTGDVFQSSNCDCGYQKDVALDIIQKSDNGIFLYDRQEGRGIGLFEKMKALELQKYGIDTYQANKNLGFLGDDREYSIPIQILKYFEVTHIKIITNNPSKLTALENAGFIIVERIQIKTEYDPYNEKYLLEKKNIGNHLLT